MQLTGSAHHGGFYRPADPPAAAAPRSAVADLILVRPNMAYRYPDPLTVVCSLGCVVAYIFALVIWAYGLHRTGLGFFYVMLVVVILGVVLSLVQTLIYYNPHLIIQSIWLSGYRVLFYTYIYTALFTLLLSVIGSWMIVRWICRSHKGGMKTNRSNQAL